MPYCVLCKSCHSEFTTYNNRSNVGCPNCGSAERHRLFGFYYEKYILEKSEIPNKINILHFAPETCLINLLRTTSDTYTCGDFDPSNYPNMQCIKMDATDIQFEDNQYDIIIASHILEHIPNDHKALTELFRVLKRGGKLIVMIPQNFNNETTMEDLTITDPNERIKLYGQHDHVRLYGLDFSKRLCEAGFFVRAYVPSDRINDVKKMKLNDVIIIDSDNKNIMTTNGFSLYDVLYECTKN